MKKLAGKVVAYLIAPEFRPFEIRLARYVGLAVLAYLGVAHA